MQSTSSGHCGFHSTCRMHNCSNFINVKYVTLLNKIQLPPSDSTDVYENIT